jgi:hypothetical protein
MGGYGSGRWHYHEKKRQVEECWVLAVSRLPLGDLERSPVTGTLRLGKRKKGLTIDFTLNSSAQAGLVLELSYSFDKGLLQAGFKESILLQNTRPNFGGVRWWLSCPLSKDGDPCKQRVSKLYLPPSEKRFGCRRCHDLTYRSCQ